MQDIHVGGNQEAIYKADEPEGTVLSANCLVLVSPLALIAGTVCLQMHTAGL